MTCVVVCTFFTLCVLDTQFWQHAGEESEEFMMMIDRKNSIAITQGFIGVGVSAEFGETGRTPTGKRVTEALDEVQAFAVRLAVSDVQSLMADLARREGDHAPLEKEVSRTFMFEEAAVIVTFGLSGFAGADADDVEALLGMTFDTLEGRLTSAEAVGRIPHIMGGQAYDGEERAIVIRCLEAEMLPEYLEQGRPADLDAVIENIHVESRGLWPFPSSGHDKFSLGNVVPFTRGTF